MRQITIYAEAKSKGDLETFTAKGLTPIVTTPSASCALLPPLIRKPFRGPYSGQISLYVKAVLGAVRNSRFRFHSGADLPLRAPG
jgi:hypothetical protein